MKDLPNPNPPTTAGTTVGEDPLFTGPAQFESSRGGDQADLDARMEAAATLARVHRGLGGGGLES